MSDHLLPSFHRRLPTAEGGEVLAVLDLMPAWDGALLTRVNVPRTHRGTGVGRALLAELCAWADRERTPVYLEVRPYPDSPLQRRELTDWYARHGWHPNPGLPGTMLRPPTVCAASEASSQPAGAAW